MAGCRISWSIFLDLGLSVPSLLRFKWKIAARRLARGVCHGLPTVAFGRWVLGLPPSLDGTKYLVAKVLGHHPALPQRQIFSLGH